MNLRNMLGRVKDQVNPFDGGKSFGNSGQGQALPAGRAMLQRAQPMQSINHGPEMYDNPDFPTGGAPMPPNRQGGPGLQMAQPQQRGFVPNLGGALVNGVQWPKGTQEDDPRLPNMRPLQVQQGSGMQEFGPRYEDDYTPSAALENTGYINPQTTPHGIFSQGYQGDNFQGGSAGQEQQLRKLLGY